jgi:hypothetical protein
MGRAGPSFPPRLSLAPNDREKVTADAALHERDAGGGKSSFLTEAGTTVPWSSA